MTTQTQPTETHPETIARVFAEIRDEVLGRDAMMCAECEGNGNIGSDDDGCGLTCARCEGLGYVPVTQADSLYDLSARMETVAENMREATEETERVLAGRAAA